MTVEQKNAVNQMQRIQVRVDNDASKRLEICLESFDEKLGWYPSGSLTLPLHQLPLLEQALAGMRCANCANEPTCVKNKIIRFPGVSASDSTVSISEVG
jgi:hypothetical protein